MGSGFWPTFRETLEPGWSGLLLRGRGSPLKWADLPGRRRHGLGYAVCWELTLSSDDGEGGRLSVLDGEPTYHFQPLADHYQFHVQDAEATDGLIDGDSWSNEASQRARIAVAQHAIAVGTARYDFVPVTLEMRAEPPAPEPLDAYDHVVEVDVELPSGRLAVTGCTQLPSEVDPVVLRPGRYRLRIAYEPDARPRRVPDDSEPGDYLTYRLTLWPVARSSGMAVLKQDSSPWAG